MKLKIEYCGEWNYYPKAAGLAESIKHKFQDLEIEYVEGSGGIFDVYLDENKIYSKFETGRFPDASEVIARIK